MSIPRPHITDWSWPRVKAAVEEAGLNLDEISRRQGMHRSWASMAKRAPYPAVQAAIARVIGVPPQDIWPSRYDEDGNPLSRKAWLDAQTQRRGDAA